jgi:L-asparaginase II
MNPDLVEVLRGGFVESLHRGALAVVDADGALRLSVGDTDRPVFPRSACKGLQALPLVASGAADALGLDDAELALACASHGGEARHVATAAAMLAKAGLDASALECGTHWPREEPVLRALVQSGGQAGPLHNNCSGKHAGFVCLGCLMARRQGRDPREFVAGYVRAEHPVMREITAALVATTGLDPRNAPVGTDGCSIPTWGIALRSLALGFARFGTGVGLSEGDARAARRLRRAVAAEPFMVSGTGRFDNRMMSLFGERVFCKVGAEGVYAVALPDQGLGVAIKIDDGNTARAAEVVCAAVIAAFLPTSDAERVALAPLCRPGLHNWNGQAVGSLRPSAGLLAALPLPNR